MITIQFQTLQKKTVLLFLLLTAMGFCIAAQDVDNNQIFESRKSAVFLVNQSIYLDESKIKNIDLFKRLEESMDKEILNQYIPLVNGTAFLINADGYFITAAHVIKYLDDANRIDSATWSFEEFISKNSIPGYLSRKELRAVFREFVRFARSADVVVSLKSIDKVDYKAEVIDQNESLDLALLKIDLDQDLTPFTISEDEEIKVGNKVLTIGFPLQFIMDSFLDDFKPTLTNGVVSAIRTDRWDLQHTASINGGNSGGPLLSETGTLIGVNVGTITKANDIYFSTNVGKLAKWLKDIGKEDVIVTK
ncbi:MAG: trypsin-like peptidase domain-containing protein [Spirochaetales bacterium]|nr:trypsin-like peptidase domain-containing protein [Spirochaetales bacterium]